MKGQESADDTNSMHSVTPLLNQELSWKKVDEAKHDQVCICN